MTAKEGQTRRTPQPTIHEGCGGIFIFDFHKVERDSKLEDWVPDERRCNGIFCGRVETYEPKKLIIIGRPGVTEEQLKQFCKSLLRKYFGVERMRNDPEILIEQDQSNLNVFAAIVYIPGAEKEIDPDNHIKLALKDEEDYNKAYELVIWAVCRKPLIRSGSPGAKK